MARKKKPVIRADSFLNSLTGIGYSGRDKRLSAEVTVNEISDRETLHAIYRGDDMGATVAEKLPYEMVRKGFTLKVDGDNENKIARAMQSKLDELDWRKAFREGLTWARVFGGAAVFAGIDDGAKDLSKPLNPATIKSIRFLTVLERHELSARYYYNNPIAAKYGLPETFDLMPLSAGQGRRADPGIRVPIHESRLILMDGVAVTRPQRKRNDGWGDSIYIRIYEVLRDYNMTWGGAAHLLSDWAQGIYKIHGLLDLIAEDPSGDLAKSRLELLEMSRSVARAIVLDAGKGADQPAEEFKRETAPLTGLPEMLQQFALRLAAAARMPVSLLMGQSPAGLNATGEADAEWYDDQISSYQEELLRPALNRLVQLLFLAKDGPTKGVEPEHWEIEFIPLTQLSEKQEAERRKMIADTDAVYIDRQVVTPEEVGATRFGGQNFNSGSIVIDMAARAAIAAEDRLAPEKPEAPEGKDPAATPPEK